MNNYFNTYPKLKHNVTDNIDEYKAIKVGEIFHNKMMEFRPK